MNNFSIKEVAQLLEVNEETIRRWIRDNKLQAYNHGGRTGYRVSAPELDKFISSNQSNATSAYSVKNSLHTSTFGSSLAGLAIGGPIGLVVGAAVAFTAGTLVNSFAKLQQQDKQLSDLVELKNELLQNKYSLELEKVQIEAKLMYLSVEIKTNEELICKADDEIHIINKGK